MTIADGPGWPQRFDMQGRIIPPRPESGPVVPMHLREPRLRDPQDPQPYGHPEGPGRGPLTEDQKSHLNFLVWREDHGVEP